MDNRQKTIHEMSLAINDVELAIGDIVDLANLFSHATNNTLMINVPLHKLRRIANCYPALNKIVNHPKFTCKE